MGEAPAAAIAAVRSWYRFERAFAAAGRQLRSTTGLTGEQLAMCRIVAEREAWAMSELRARLSMHPATLGQALARLAEKGFVRVERDGEDGRRRKVAVTAAGAELLDASPLIGPVRLRSVDAAPEDLETLRRGFALAVELFGLEPWAGGSVRTKENEDE